VVTGGASVGGGGEGEAITTGLVSLTGVIVISSAIRRSSSDFWDDERNTTNPTDDAHRRHTKMTSRNFQFISYFQSHIFFRRIGVVTSSDMKKSTRLLPVSGSEPRNINAYKTPRAVGRNNCMAFAFGEKGVVNGQKQQPGNKSGLKNVDFPLTSCGPMIRRVLRDYKGSVYRGSVGTPCKPGYAKVMPFIAKGRDFHWYRQEPNGMWAHKRGLTPVTKKDACGKPIVNPRTSCRDFGDGLDYATPCPVLCRKTFNAKKNLSAPTKKKNNAPHGQRTTRRVSRPKSRASAARHRPPVWI